MSQPLLELKRDDEAFWVHILPQAGPFSCFKLDCTYGGVLHHSLCAALDEQKVSPQLPRVPELDGAFPVVLYFRTDEEREEFSTMVRELNPHMTVKSI